MSGSASAMTSLARSMAVARNTIVAILLGCATDTSEPPAKSDQDNPGQPFLCIDIPGESPDGFDWFRCTPTEDGEATTWYMCVPSGGSGNYACVLSAVDPDGKWYAFRAGIAAIPAIGSFAGTFRYTRGMIVEYECGDPETWKLPPEWCP